MVNPTSVPYNIKPIYSTPIPNDYTCAITCYTTVKKLLSTARLNKPFNNSFYNEYDFFYFRFNMKGKIISSKEY